MEQSERERRMKENPTRILLVDDDIALLDGLSRSLRKEPYRVFTECSPERALGLLAKAQFDVVVSDEKMPGMSGIQFLTCVRQKHPDVTRVMLTGRSSFGIAQGAINHAGVYRFLSKPCNEIDLAVTIRDAVRFRQERLSAESLFEVLLMQRSYIRALEDDTPGAKSADEGRICIPEDGPSAEEVLRALEEEENTAI